MTPPLTTVNVTAQATLLYGSQGSDPTPIQITNQDTTHTVWIGNTSNIMVGGTNTNAVGPGASVGFDGSVSVYGVCGTGVSVAVAVTPGGTSYSPGTIAINGNVNATVSGNVNVTNTPNVNIGTAGQVKINGQVGALDVSAATVNINPAAGYILPGNKGNLFTSVGALNIPAATGASPIINTDIRTYAAVDISLSVHCATQGTVGAPVTSKLSLQWFDDAAGSNLIYEEDWFVWVANTVTPARAFGTFPMRGQYLTVTVFNTGGQTVSLDFCTITGTYRSFEYSSLRQIPPNMTVTGAIIGALGNLSLNNSLGSINNQTPGVGLAVYPMPIYAGPVSYYWSVNTAGLVNVPTFIDMGQVTSGNLAAGTGQQGLIKALSNTIGTAEAMSINFPRSPVGLVVNPAATSQIQFSAIGQQGY